MRVSRRALMAVARADAAAADHATGRWVATANATVAHADDPMAWLTRRQTMLMARFPHAQNEVIAMCHIVRTALEADMAAGTRWED